MLYSIYIYSAAFGLSLLGANLYQKNIDKYGNQHFSMQSMVNRSVWILLLLLPPVIIATFRDSTVGTDYLSYYRIFNMVKKYNLQQYIELKKYNKGLVEYGYQTICHFVYKLGGSFIWVNFVSEFLIIFFIWRGMLYFHKEYGINMVYGMFLFYMLQYPYGLNVVRFSIAVAIFFYGLKFLLEKKPIQYFVVCVFASLFHTTLVISFLFYFVNIFTYRFMRKWAKTIIVILLFFVIYNLRDLMRLVENLTFLRKYFEADMYQINEQATYGLGVWVFILLQYVLLAFFWNLIRGKSGKMQIVLILSLLYIPFRFLGYYNEWISRFTHVAELCWCAVVPYVVVTVEKDSNRKILFGYYTIYALSSYFINYFIMNYSQTYPFRWIKM